MGRERLARGTELTPSRELDRGLRLHTRCSEPRDWWGASTAPPPPREPAYIATADLRAARAELEGFRPRLFDRMRGRADARRSLLEDRVRRATAADAANYEDERTRHRAVIRDWKARSALAAGVLRHDLVACRAALPAIDDFSELGIRFELASIADGCAHVACVLAAPRYTRAHVWSCAIRAAREAFAALPVHDAIVEIAVERRDPVTGVSERRAVLTAGFADEMMAGLAVLADASDALVHVPHRPTPTTMHTPTPTPVS